MNSHFLLRSLISSAVRNFKKNIHTSSSYKAPEVWQPNKSGREEEETKSLEEELWEQKSFTEKVKLEYKLLKGELKLFKEEVKSLFTAPPLAYRKGEVDVVWRFTEDPEYLEKWIVTSDSDNNGGFSCAKLELSPHGHAIFSGTLDTRVPKDGRLTDAGYCNLRTVNYMKSFGREAAMDWSCYTHLRMRVRGDGRFYMINIGTKQTFDVQWFEIYNYVLMTRGGPYWQDIKIPFSKFFMSHKGRIQDSQRPLELDTIKNIGFTCADKICGPFRLEIDYIGLENDPFAPEKFAYETYHTTTMKM